MRIINERNVFLYWVGQEFKLIKILRNLIYLHSIVGKGYHVHLITPKNIKEYLSEIPECFYRLQPAFQADFVRVNAVCQYGGIWIDSDTLVLESLDSLFEYLEKKDGFFIREGESNHTVCNGLFGSKKNTPLMNEIKNEINNILFHKQENLCWCEIGNYIFQNFFVYRSYLYQNYEIINGLENMYPIMWESCVNEFLNQPYDNYKNIIRDYQPLLVLVHTVYQDAEKYTYEDLLDGNRPINYFLNKSLQSFKTAMSLKTNELINDKTFKSNVDLLNKNLTTNTINFDNPNENIIRYLTATNLSKKMLTIGVENIQLTLFFLSSNKNLKLYQQTISEDNLKNPIEYQKGITVLQKLFGDRFNILDSNKNILETNNQNLKCEIDVVYINRESTEIKKELLSIKPYLSERPIIIVENTHLELVSNVVNNLVEDKIVIRVPQFPKMDDSNAYQNEIIYYKE